jgi:primosomal protein N' (replication factor Y)
VAGRQGGDQKGQVIIQTFNPDHYAITDARNHDYRSFFEKEKELREQLGYPPFSYLACLRLQGNTQGSAEEMSRRFAQEVGRMKERWPKQGKEILILGPVEAPFKKLKGKYRWQILVKSKRRGLLHLFLEKVNSASEAFLRGTGVTLIIDVDPYQMM